MPPIWRRNGDYHGGTFKDLDSYHHIYSMSTMHLCTDDVVITGLKVTENFEETDTDKVQSFLFGTEGYVIAIEGNDLIQKGAAETIARSIGGKVIGMRFRPFDVSALNDPSMEAGDPVIVTDRKQRSYQSYITSTTFKAGNYQQVQCNAETPSRNNAQRFSETTRSIVKARREAARRISDYDKAVQMMNQLAANTFGFFSTNVLQEDGSIIAYRHDKPTLAESKTVYKSGIDGFWVTQDFQGNDGATAAAGKWETGFDSSGNAVLNVLSVIGINFDWAHGGTLTLGGQNNVSGKMRILDASGKQIGNWDAIEGFVATKGKFSGSLEAATGTFKGNLSAAGGTFSGELKAATGIFSGNLSAAGGSFSGSLEAATGTFFGKLESIGEESRLEINGGALSGRRNTDSNNTGYVSFDTYWVNTGISGTRIAGKGVVAIYTPYFGTGDWTELGERGTISVGKSGSIKVITDVTLNKNKDGNYSIGKTTKTISFTKGIMTTAL